MNDRRHTHRIIHISLALCLISIPLWLMLFFPQPSPVQAAAITVNTLGDDNTVNGNCTLREAILAANTNAAVDTCTSGAPGLDTISFSVTGTIVLSNTLGTLSITSTLEILGPGESSLTISGNNAVGVMEVNYPFTLHLSDVTIANGKAGTGGGISNFGTLNITNTTFYSNIAMGLGNNGGGIHNNGGTVNIVNSKVYSNTSSARGGGIYNQHGTVNITNSNVYSNVATTGATLNVGGAGIYNTGGALNIANSGVYSNTSSGSSTNGGGIRNTSNGTVTVSSSLLSENSAPNGAGIFSDSGTVNISSSTLSGNSASGSISFGGGISISGTLTLTNSTLSGNVVSGTLSGGGAIHITGTLTTLTVSNSTLTGNSVSGTLSSGGGFFIYTGTMTATNSTIASNNASTAGGGIRKGAGSVTLRNTIVAYNLASSEANCSGGIDNGGNNIDSGGTCGWGSASGSKSNTDPHLGPLANNGGSTQTMALLPGSPAIDTANLTNCPATDQRGTPRPIGAGCDIGAFEAVYLFLPLIEK